jgi:hypothetical protein
MAMSLRLAAACAAAAVLAAGGTVTGAITPFSRASPGIIPAAWQPLLLPRVKAPEFSLVEEGAARVLRIRSEAAAGSLAHRLAVRSEGAHLSWRWRVDRVIERADLLKKEGDDYAARLYVFFDVPESELTFAQRATRSLARILHGAEVPTAALCYVWDNRQPAGSTAWNAYTDRVRMIVVRSGGERAGQWVEESRDLEADFRAAFGPPAARELPRISGVAVAADTDQTGESVTAWFGDLRLDSRP